MSLRMIKHVRTINFLASLLLALVQATAPSFAQSFRGSIRGTVIDPSGGVVPGTKIQPQILPPVKHVTSALD